MTGRKRSTLGKRYDAAVERWTDKIGMHPGMYILVLMTTLYFAARIGGAVVGPAAYGAWHTLQSWLVS